MKTEVKKISSIVSQLKVVVDAQTVSQDYNEILSKYRKLTVVKGFRKGKAPLAMVERYYGSYIKEEFNETISDKYYKEAIEEAKVKPVSPGMVKDMKWEKGQDMEIIYEFETDPEFELKPYMNVEIPHEDSPLAEDALEKEIEKLRDSAATLEEITTGAESGDIVSGSLQILSADDERVLQEKNETITINDNEFSEEFNKALIGKLAGDEVKEKIFKSEDGQKYIGKFIIDAVKRKNLPELNDDFAKDLDYENLEEMKKQVKEELEKEAEKANKNQLRTDIINYLVKENDFEVPTTFVYNYANEMMKPYAGQLDQKAKEQLWPMFADNAKQEVKKYYILQKIKEEMAPEVTEEIRNEFINELAKNMNMEPEKYKKMYKERIETEDFEETLKERIVLDKIAESAKFIPYPKEEKKADDKVEDAEIIEEVKE